MKTLTIIFLYLVLFGMVQVAFFIASLAVHYGSPGKHSGAEKMLVAGFSLLNVGLFIVFLWFIPLFKRSVIIWASVLTIVLWMVEYILLF